MFIQAVASLFLPKIKHFTLHLRNTIKFTCQGISYITAWQEMRSTELKSKKLKDKDNFILSMDLWN